MSPDPSPSLAAASFMQKWQGYAGGGTPATSQSHNGFEDIENLMDNPELASPAYAAASAPQRHPAIPHSLSLAITSPGGETVTTATPSTALNSAHDPHSRGMELNSSDFGSGLTPNTGRSPATWQGFFKSNPAGLTPHQVPEQPQYQFVPPTPGVLKLQRHPSSELLRGPGSEPPTVPIPSQGRSAGQAGSSAAAPAASVSGTSDAVSSSSSSFSSAAATTTTAASAASQGPHASASTQAQGGGAKSKKKAPKPIPLLKSQTSSRPAAASEEQTKPIEQSAAQVEGSQQSDPDLVDGLFNAELYQVADNLLDNADLNEVG